MAYTKTVWVNNSTPALNDTNMNKIEQGIFDCIRQDGTTTMSAQLSVISGTVGTPSISPIGDSDTGMFFAAANTVNFGVGGTQIFELNPSGQFAIHSGSVSIPSITRKGDTNTGIYFPTADSVAFVTNGTEVIQANPNGQVVISSGTVGTPSFTTTGDTNTGLYFPATDTLAITTAGVERLRVGSTGSVAIGTLSTTEKLEVSDSSATTVYAKVTNTDATGNAGLTLANTGTGGRSFQLYVPGNSATSYKNSLVVYDTGVSAVRLLLNASGYLLIGYTTNNGAYPLQVNGQIFATSATIATSDRNYKENVVALDGALNIVNALNPVQFDWKEHPVHKFDRNQPTIGFIAQEVENVLVDKPYLKSIVKTNETEYEKDGVLIKEEFKGIAEGNLIALLTKAVQELSAKVDVLSAKVEALEAAK